MKHFIVLVTDQIRTTAMSIFMQRISNNFIKRLIFLVSKKGKGSLLGRLKKKAYSSATTNPAADFGPGKF
ncbi:hypothetical protein [uncultured Imperialibacter sp.]|uniref:hypothetical protein n=1 Tax=uncultured Imperialibacter sp. TaxID=1672639 RepID=UPI0030DB58FA|tara:strand:- start:1261 stop:1470 length:210 start_codon:yes stop_codon:yes gene_type:complete